MLPEIKKAKDVDPEAWVRVIPESAKLQMEKQRSERAAQITKQIALLQAEKAAITKDVAVEKEEVK